MASSIGERLQELDEYEFEYFVGELWERRGWSTEVTSRSTDRGIDVVATKDTPYPEKQLIQVKCYSEDNKVGSPDVQQYASLRQQEENVDAVLIVTTSGFTQNAQTIADRLNVKLIDRESIEQLIDETDSFDLLSSYTPPKESDSSKSDSSIDKSREQNWLTDTLSEDPNQYNLYSLLKTGDTDSYLDLNLTSLANEVGLGDLASQPIGQFIKDLSKLTNIVKNPRIPEALTYCPLCYRESKTVGYEVAINQRTLHIVECSWNSHWWYNTRATTTGGWETFYEPAEDYVGPLNHWENIRPDSGIYKPHPFSSDYTLEKTPSKFKYIWEDSVKKFSNLDFENNICPECGERKSLWGAETDEQILFKCEKCQTVWKQINTLPLLREDRAEYIECNNNEVIGVEIKISEFSGE